MNRKEYIEFRGKGDIVSISYNYYKNKGGDLHGNVFKKIFLMFLNFYNIGNNINNIYDYFDKKFSIVLLIDKENNIIKIT